MIAPGAAKQPSPPMPTPPLQPALPFLTGAAPPSSPSLFAGLLLAAGVLLLTIVALMRYRKRLRNRSHTDASPDQRMKRLAERQRSVESLDGLMVQVQELTRECAAQIDNRAAKLEKLLREADEKIRHLERLQRESAPTARAAQWPSSGTKDSDISDAETSDPLTRQVLTLAEEGLEPLQIAQRLDEQVGKVSLILALRRRGGSSSRARTEVTSGTP